MTDQPSRPFQEYPKMVYHMDGSHKTVQNREEHQALGPQWFRSPVDAAAASPALWFRTQLQIPINEAVLNADSKFQRAKDRILKGGEITELDLKSLAVQFVLDVFPAITGQARQLLNEGLCTKHRLLDEVDKRLRHLVRYAAQRMLRPLNDDEFNAWVLQEVKGTPEYSEALRLALNAESVRPDAEPAQLQSEDRVNIDGTGEHTPGNQPLKSRRGRKKGTGSQETRDLDTAIREAKRDGQRTTNNILEYLVRKESLMPVPLPAGWRENHGVKTWQAVQSKSEKDTHFAGLCGKRFSKVSA